MGDAYKRYSFVAHKDHPKYMKQKFFLADLKNFKEKKGHLKAPISSLKLS